MRHWFGRSPADWTFDTGPGNIAVLTSGTILTFWSAATGGDQYDDLLDSAGAPTTTITSGDGSTLPIGTIPEFQGPDEISELWVDADGGTRYKMVATDLGDSLDGKLSRSGGTMDGTLWLEDDAPAASVDYVDAAVAGIGGGAPLILPYAYEGIVSASTGASRIYNDTGRDLTIGTVRASVGTAPAGASLIVDVHKSGTTIYTTQANRPTITAGQQTGTGATPDVATWAEGEYLTVDVDQVGSTTPGSNLTVTIAAT